MVKAFGLSKSNLLQPQLRNNMKSKILLTLSLLFMPLISSAQQAVDLGQVALSKWRIGTGNYSGIASLGNNRYAVVSDKEITDGFFTFLIDQNATTGAIESVYLESFKGNSSPKVSAATGISVRDCEGIAYFPSAGTVFIAGEGDQKILEYNMDGQPTGRELTVPKIFGLGNIVPNYGFESLATAQPHIVFGPPLRAHCSKTETPQDRCTLENKICCACNLSETTCSRLHNMPTAWTAERPTTSEKSMSTACLKLPHCPMDASS